LKDKRYRLEKKRVLTTTEIDKMFELEQSCSEDMTPIYETRNDLKEEVTQPGTINFLVYNLDELIGYGTLSDLDETGFEIANVAVRKGYREQGLGKMLMEKQLEQIGRIIANPTKVCLHTAMRNGVMQSICQHLGFRKEKIEEKYYWNGEDAITLFKNVMPQG